MRICNSLPSPCGTSLFLCAWLLCSGLCSSVASQDLSAYLAARNVPRSTGQQRLETSLRVAAQMAAHYGPAAVGALENRALRVRSDGSVEVYIHTDRLTQTELQSLQQQGAQIIQTLEQFGLVYAAVAADALERVAALSFVRWVNSPSPGTLRIGSVTSLGDTVLRAEEARNRFDVDGSGVRIGIISDSLINLGASVASEDLPPPPNVRIVNGQDGSTLVNPTDEGRALAEIIHDLAPGATLLFHSGFPDAVAMHNAINALVEERAHIIIDDIGFFGEPIFEDGIVAQTVQAAIDAGVVYVTAAGNDADRHYQGLYVDADPEDPDRNLHDFGGGDTALDVQLAPGETMIAVLQWPNPFDGSQNDDYDLLVFDTTGTTALFDADGLCSMQQGLSGFCASMDDQTNTQAPPLEIVSVTNSSGAPVMLTVLINRVSGTESRLLEMHFSRGAQLQQEHIVAESSIFGHPCVAEVLAVGAINANNTIEPFSSQGPCEIFFPIPKAPLKPDLVATDGVNTSLPGSLRTFFGTSAAAPHVAAIAALLMDAAGGPEVFSNTRIANFMRQTAVDLGAPGFDPIFGNGRVDAVEAILALRAVAPPANSGQGGGGGGCSLLPTAVSSSPSVLEALGNILLPVVVLLLIRTWRWYRFRA